MKKLLSLLVVAMMMLTFAVSVSAATGVLADVVEGEDNVTISIYVTDAAQLKGFVMYLKYDPAKLDKASATQQYFGGIAEKGWTISNLAKTTIGNDTYFKLNATPGSDTSKIFDVTGTVKLAEVVVNKVAGATIDADTIKLAVVRTNAAVATLTAGSGITSGSTTYSHKTAAHASMFSTAFSPYSAGGAGDDVVAATTFAKYYADGTTVCVFGKAATGASEAGIYVTKDGAALEHSTAMAKTTKGAGFFPAYKSDITAAFGVQIQDLEAGAYTAAVYSDDTTTTAVEFTIAG